MKYKLLKPIKGIDTKVGEEIELHTPYMAFISNAILQLLLDNGYIQEYDPNKKWIPEENEEYYFLDTVFVPSKTIYWNENIIDVKRASAGNCFKTLQEAEATAKKIKQFVSNGMK